MEKPLRDIGRVHIEYSKDKNKENEIVACRIFLGKKIANLGIFKNKERVKVYLYPDEKKIIIEEF